MDGYKEHITEYPNFPKDGVNFKDLSPLIADEQLFRSAVVDMGRQVRNPKYWVGIDSRGFIFASPLSYILSKPLILMRKKDKLPALKHSIEFELEYGKSTLEMHKDSINNNEKIVIVDDLIATGGTAEAAGKLIEKAGGDVSAYLFAINLFDLGGKDKLRKKGYRTFSLMDFPGH